MLLYGAIDPVSLGNGAVQVTARVAPGPSASLSAPIAVAVLRAAAADFLSTKPSLLEQFTPSGVAAGAVADLSVSDDGTMEVTFTVTGGPAATKVAAGVYKAGALALRVTARDPVTGTVAKAQIYAASLIDRPDDSAFLAKARPAGGPVRDAIGRLDGIELPLLNISARLMPFERHR